MISRISVLVATVVSIAFSGSALAQFGGNPAPPVLPYDYPYLYNPESATTTVDFNGGGNNTGCGVSWVDYNTGYTLPLPVSMDRMMEMPFNLPNSGIDYMCIDTQESNPGSVLTIEPPEPNVTLPYGLTWVYQRTVDGEEEGIVYDVFTIQQETSDAITNTTLKDVFEDTIIPLTEDNCLNPDPTEPVIVPASDCIQSLYPTCITASELLSLIAVPPCDATDPMITPSTWDVHAAHAATAFPVDMTLPKEFRIVFDTFKKRMMAANHNFWVQNNDTSVTFFEARQTYYKFRILAVNSMRDELISTYNTWYDSQP